MDCLRNSISIHCIQQHELSNRLHGKFRGWITPLHGLCGNYDHKGVQVVSYTKTESQNCLTPREAQFDEGILMPVAEAVMQSMLQDQGKA